MKIITNACAALAVFAIIAPLTRAAEVTPITDIVYLADGSTAPVGSTITISWPRFTSVTNHTVPKGSKTVAIGADGSFTISLEPNDTATPAFTYTVRYNIVGQSPMAEYWTIPTSDTPQIIQEIAGDTGTNTTPIIRLVSKGQIPVFDGENMQALSPGANGTALVADSTNANGVKFGYPSAIPAVNIGAGDVDNAKLSVLATATYKPLASALVQRDGNGGFRAGGVTANIVGAMSQQSLITGDGTLTDAFPGLVQLADGTLIVFYREGAGHLGKGSVYKRTSTDNGKSWSAAVLVLTDGTLDVRDPSPTLLSDGSILLSFFYEVPDGAATTAEVIKSTDSGATWGSPVTVNPFTGWSAVSSPAVQLSNGDVLLSTYGVNSGDTFSSVKVSKSTDGGATWASLSTPANGQTASKAYTEPQLVALSSSSVLALMRNDTDVQISTSLSTDSGATWGTVTSRFSGTGAPRTVELSDGALFTGYRSQTAPFVNRLAYRISGDGGSNWTPEVIGNLDPILNFMVYQSSKEISPGLIGSAYCTQFWDTTQHGNCYLKYLSENSIYSAPAVNASGVYSTGDIAATTGAYIRGGSEVLTKNSTYNTDGSEALSIQDNTSTPKKLVLGIDDSAGVGYIQHIQPGTGYEPLALNPNGAEVRINTTAELAGDASYHLQVHGRIFADDNIKTTGTVIATKLTGVLSTGSVSSTDQAGGLTVVSGTATHAFSGTYATAPVCVATDNTNSAHGFVTTVTTTGVTFSAATSGDVIWYICVPRT